MEEFNVSIGQFVGNLKGDREKFANIILGFELLLMDKLHYHLTVHNPFRPLEGFFIDIKVSIFREKFANSYCSWTNYITNPVRPLEEFFIDIKVSIFREKLANIIRPLVKSAY